MSNIAIRATDLSKQYRIGVTGRGHDTLRDLIADSMRSVFRSNSHGLKFGQPPDFPNAIWALKAVSF